MGVAHVQNLFESEPTTAGKMLESALPRMDDDTLERISDENDLSDEDHEPFIPRAQPRSHLHMQDSPVHHSQHSRQDGDYKSEEQDSPLGVGGRRVHQLVARGVSPNPMLPPANIPNIHGVALVVSSQRGDQKPRKGSRSPSLPPSLRTRGLNRPPLQACARAHNTRGCRSPGHPRYALANTT